jgi:hypothetical protein
VVTGEVMMSQPGADLYLKFYHALDCTRFPHGLGGIGYTFAEVNMKTHRLKNLNNIAVCTLAFEIK